MTPEHDLFDAVTAGMKSLFGPWSEHVEERIWTVDGDLGMLKVRSLNGGILVRGADQEELVVRAVKTVRGPTKEMAESFAPRVHIRKSQIRDGFYLQAVYPRPPLACTVFVRFEIAVPWALDVELYTQNGGVAVSGVEGAVDVETRSGNIDLVDTTGPAKLHTASGAIRASGVEGAIEAESGQGQIVIERCAGYVKLRTTRGDISITDYEGNVRARSYQGDIQLVGATGGADLEAASGDVSASFSHLKAPGIFQSGAGSVAVVLEASEAYLEAEALDGSVVVRLPDGYAGMLDAGTAGGVIDCAIPLGVIQQAPILLTGRLGDGYGPLVKLRTFDGDISIKAIAGDDAR